MYMYMYIVVFFQSRKLWFYSFKRRGEHRGKSARVSVRTSDRTCSRTFARTGMEIRLALVKRMHFVYVPALGDCRRFSQTLDKSGFQSTTSM